MRVWLLKSGEPSPTDPGRQRLHRTGLLAETLAARGFWVTWWTSTFRHEDKQFRYPETTWKSVNDRLKICFLHTRPYRRNVSVERIRFNVDIARAFAREAERVEPPDAILSAYPIPEFAEAAARYARPRNIPCVVDVRDLWPDVWATVAPSFLRPLAHAALLPFYLRSSRTLRLFDGIWGVTDEMVEWGLTRARRRRGAWDLSFPLAYAEDVYTETEQREAEDFWQATLPRSEPPQLRLCFFGNIALGRGRQDVMVDAMRYLPDDMRGKVQLVLCGSGEDLDKLRQMAADIPQAVLPGRVTGPQIQALARRSAAGILPYPSHPDFRRSMPNKVIEYLAYGLPILTSLQGPVSRLVEGEGCGVLYAETDARDLARTIAELFNAPQELGRLSQNARRLFRDRFAAADVYGRVGEALRGMSTASAASPSA